MMIRGKRRVIRLAPHQWVFVAVAFAFAVYGMSPVRVEPSFTPDSSDDTGAVQLSE